MKLFDLKWRIIMSLAQAIGVGALLFFSKYYLIVAGVIGLAAVTALWEYVQLASKKGIRLPFILLAICCFVQVFSFPISANLAAWAFFGATMLLFLWHFRQKEGAIADVGGSLFGLLYVAVPMGMAAATFYLPAGGMLWVAYLIAVVKSSDIAAYFGGHLLGRRRLAPAISPGKTVEGALCGFICAMGAAILFKSWIPAPLWLGALLAVAGQFGDLAESLLKRDANQKDSNVLPGVGGILDAIDSLLLSAPILYFYLSSRTL
jgi:phosphatidate cytidylyltransferase